MAVALFALAATGFLGCTDTSAKGGVGAKCVSNDDCQATSCNAGLCTKNCATDIDCPSPTQCFKSLCQYPLRVGAMYSGSPDAETEGWTFANAQSVANAGADLGYVVGSFEGQIYGSNDPPLIAPAVKRLVEEQHADVIVATDSSEGAELKALYADYPQVKFLYYKEPGSSFYPKDGPGNVATHSSNSVPGWYLAGKIAVQATHAKRLGIIGPALVPSAVQSINAFARGAQSEDPSVIVEVRWVGFWIDINNTGQFAYKGATYFREDLIAQQLVDAGAEVVASLGDSGRPIRLIEAKYKATAKSIAANAQFSWRDLQTGNPISSCLGSVYFNFTPYIEEQLDAIHKQTWQPSDYLGLIDKDLAKTTIGFQPNSSSNIDDANVKKLALTLAGQTGLDIALKGPYETTGQLDLDNDGKYDAVQKVGDGVVLNDTQLANMCWFVKGIVEKQNLDDSTDASAQASVMTKDVDAHVPDDKYPPGKGVIVDFGANCKTGH
jgi:basic membrane lipoprotein Med (substrate-binding protein (PBP1-ABC) superfamily)